MTSPRGPAPLPTKLKLVQGTRESRVNRNEPRARAALPVLAPDAAPAVREVWDRVLGELVVMGTAHAADQDCLRAYCEAVVTHAKTCRLLADSDVLIKGLHGPVRNPVVAQQRDAAHLIRTLAQEFGLTPSARSRIDTHPARDADANPFAGDA